MGDAVVVSPKLLTKAEKVSRWEDLWIPDVVYIKNA